MCIVPAKEIQLSQIIKFCWHESFQKFKDWTCLKMAKYTWKMVCPFLIVSTHFPKDLSFSGNIRFLHGGLQSALVVIWLTAAAICTVHANYHKSSCKFSKIPRN